MVASMKHTVVIGAGAAGLVTSYHLSRSGHDHVVLERARIGETWCTQRWSSFVLNTPAPFNILPGENAALCDARRFFTAAEFVNRLVAFARAHRLPVRLQTQVVSVNRESESSGYVVETPDATYRARNVVIASGGLTRPSVPAITRQFPPAILQLHSSQYRSHDHLPPGPVLVIGSGQSGCQIAEDLLENGREVFLSTSRVGRLPRRYRGQDILEWEKDLGILDKTRDDLSDSGLMRKGMPQLSGTRGGHTVSLQSLRAEGTTLLGRLRQIDGTVLVFDDDLAKNLAFGDQLSRAQRERIDQHIARLGLEAPLPEQDPGESAGIHLQQAGPTELRLDSIGSVIWCTGFTGNFDFIRLPLLDRQGAPRHRMGATEYPGLFLVGLPWLSKRKSGLIYGMDEDARRIVAGLSD